MTHLLTSAESRGSEHWLVRLLRFLQDPDLSGLGSARERAAVPRPFAGGTRSSPHRADARRGRGELAWSRARATLARHRAAWRGRTGARVAVLGRRFRGSTPASARRGATRRTPGSR